MSRHGLQHRRRPPAVRKYLPAGLALAAGAVAVLIVLHMTTRTPDQPSPSSGPPPGSARPPLPPQNLASVIIAAPDGSTRLRLTAEVADDEQSRELGLMYRPALARTHGMLFLFEQEDLLSFWMKNTRMPLDMIFADRTGRIVTIHRNTTPYAEYSYAATEPAMIVLEVAAGVAEEAKIATGDRITWTRRESAGPPS